MISIKDLSYIFVSVLSRALHACRFHSPLSRGQGVLSCTRSERSRSDQSVELHLGWAMDARKRSRILIICTGSGCVGPAAVQGGRTTSSGKDCETRCNRKRHLVHATHFQVGEVVIAKKLKQV
jgi:hypothetical protein